MKNDNVKSIEKLIDTRQFLIEKAPFAQLYNFVIQHLIDIDALAIWVYYQSKPDTWRPRKKEVEKHFMLSERKIHNAHMVLKECGLYEAIDRREKGKIIQWQVNIRCGIGCEQLILAWKERHIEEKKTKKLAKSHNVQKRHSGEYSKTHAQQGEIQNGEKPQCDKTPVIYNKGRSLKTNKKELLQTNETVVVVNNSLKNPDARLRTAYRANPFVTDKIKDEEDFIEAANYSISNRDNGITEEQRIRGIIKLVGKGIFKCPEGWKKNTPKNNKIEDKTRLQEEYSLKLYEEEQKLWKQRIKTQPKEKPPIDFIHIGSKLKTNFVIHKQ